MKRFIPNKIWQAFGVILLLSPFANQAQAVLASQVVPASYQPNQYCTDGIQPTVPRGSASKRLVADISCINQQLKRFQSEENPTNIRYQAYRAQAWLSYLAHEESEKSLTRAGNYALSEALSILQALKSDQGSRLPLDADIPPTSGLKRPDLWASLLSIKRTPAFDVIPKDIAYSEVKLIWAEAEFCEFGWRHAREHFSAADRWIKSAEVTALNHDGVDNAHFNSLKTEYYSKLKPLSSDDKLCRGAILPEVIVAPPEVPQPPPPEPEPEPIVPPPVEPEPEPLPPPVEPELTEAEEILLKPYVVHFALDKSVLTPDSQAVVDEMLEKVVKHYNLSDITFDLYGFTDKRASVKYNLALSKRRTGSVASYLMKQGIKASQIAEYPEGEANLKREEEDVNSHALNRRVEIYLSRSGQSIIDAQAAQQEMQRSDYEDLKPER